MTSRILAAPALWCAAAAAAPDTFNESALARGFALPALGQTHIAEPRHWDQQIDFDLVNEFFLGNNDTESLEVDGESTRIAWRGVYGVAPGWDAGVVVPYYIVGGGFLDGTIEGWHHFFHMPNANRDKVPRNQIHYVYVRDGQTLLDDESSGHGFGEVRLQAGRAIGDAVALRAQLKLPTGNAGHLLGNKAWGGALWVDYRLPFDADSRFEGFVSGGLSYTGKGDVLPDQQRTFVPFGGAGVSCRLIGNFGAQVQWGIHSALYRDSELTPLHSVGAPLWFGVNYAISPQTRLEALAQEDSVVYGSPDFIIHLAVAFH